MNGTSTEQYMGMDSKAGGDGKGMSPFLYFYNSVKGVLWVKELLDNEDVHTETDIRICSG